MKEPFGYINQLLITDFTMPSILWGIDGDWMISYMPENHEFYPTDHCGVLRCKTDKVNPRYLAHILEREGIKNGFSRAYRASIDRIKGITFTVPDRRKQDKVVFEIENLEKQIVGAQEAIKAIKDKLSMVLHTYLD